METKLDSKSRIQTDAEVLNALLQQAIGLQSLGHLDAAELIYRRALKLAPRNADAHHLLGLISKSRGEIPSAIAHISHAISINPVEAVFYNNLSTCYLAQKDMVAAELCLNRALTLRPTYPDALNNLSVVLIGQERWSDAIDAIDKALSLQPNHELSTCNRAKALCGQQQYEGSLMWCQKTLQINPKSTPAMFCGISCLTKLDRFDEALAMTELVSNVDPTLLPTAMEAKANLLEVAGRMDEAKQALDRGLAVNPGGIELNYARSRIAKVKRDDPFFQCIRKSCSASRCCLVYMRD